MLSHEVRPLERHDADTRSREHSFLHRFFGYTEDQEAHWRSLKTAWRLWPEHHSVWNALGWEWILDVLCWIWPTPVALLEIPRSISTGRKLVTQQS